MSTESATHIYDTPRAQRLTVRLARLEGEIANVRRLLTLERQLTETVAGPPYVLVTSAGVTLADDGEWRYRDPKPKVYAYKAVALRAARGYDADTLVYPLSVYRRDVAIGLNTSDSVS